MRVGTVTIIFYLMVAKDQVLSTGFVHRIIVSRHKNNEKSNDSLENLLQATIKKLENQELREKQLDDRLEKALEVFETRMQSQDSAINAFKADLSTVKEKLTKIEGVLNQKSEREKGSYAIDPVRLESSISDVLGMLKKQALLADHVLSKQQFEKTESNVNDKINLVTSIVGRIEKELLDSLNQSKNANKYDSLFNKLESQLEVQEKEHNSVITKLEHLESTNEELIACKKQQTDNYTKEALAEINNKIQYLGSDKLMNIDAKLQEIMRSNNQLQHFSMKGEQMLLTTADNLFETRKRVESGIQEILLRIGELVKSETQQLNDTFKNSFDEMSDTIIKNQNNGVSSLNSKIDSEISQVWRLFGILHEKLVNSEKALSKLELQTVQYLSENLNTNDCMNGSVLEIASKVSDVKENVTSLMSRMLLLIQEFNQTKGDLLTAFENLRNNFESLHQDIEHQGPSQVATDLVDVRSYD